MAEPDRPAVQTAEAPGLAVGAMARPAPSFVYAIGQIDARFPSLSIEKEFAQVAAMRDDSGLTDRQVLKRTISAPENRYLARGLCWIQTVDGLETYILTPRDPYDLALFIEAFREEPRRDDLDVVIGVRGPMAGPEVCNGLSLPIVVVDQLYSFDRDTLIESIPKPDSVADDDLAKFRATAGDRFDELTHLADNAGSLDEHRAVNYLTVRYPGIYAVAAEQYDRNFACTGVQVLPSAMSGVRSIVDVVFSYSHRQTDAIERQFVRVDVSEEFPFLASKMNPYYGN
jgi:PatG Domain